MATVYILYSKKLDRFYTGSCAVFETRWKDHLNKRYKDAFTTLANDWEVFLRIDNLELDQARSIEKHIKKMKSKSFILNLRKYPELLLKILKPHGPGSPR